ncbi:MAG TPA: menaquinone biosynthesis protein [Planctomycetota bacterium]|nr:menaquinone biosynthesis protein [Planctomycetota bacterium]
MLTLGNVPYLNTVPLAAFLPPDVGQREADPGVLADWLRAGTVDAAMLPVAEALRGAGDGYVGRYGIACDGGVESVLAFLPVADAPPAAWPRHVVLDPASRTSQALLRVLLERRFGLAPTYEVAPAPGPDPRSRPDAVTLVIGDRALRHREGWPGGVLDLGAAWKEWTGLPFVFARWTARRGLPAAEREALARILDEAARAGLAQRDALATAHGPRHGLSAEAARRYFRKAVVYEIDARAEAGLERFARELRALEGRD